MFACELDPAEDDPEGTMPVVYLIQARPSFLVNVAREIIERLPAEDVVPLLLAALKRAEADGKAHLVPMKTSN